MAGKNLNTGASTNDFSNYTINTMNSTIPNGDASFKTSSKLVVHRNGHLIQTTISLQTTSHNPQVDDYFVVGSVAIIVLIVLMLFLVIVLHCKRKRLQYEIEKTAAIWSNDISNEQNALLHVSPSFGQQGRNNEVIAANLRDSDPVAPLCAIFDQAEPGSCRGQLPDKAMAEPRSSDAEPTVKMEEIDHMKKVDIKNSSSDNFNNLSNGTNMYLVSGGKVGYETGYEKVDFSHTPCFSEVKNGPDAASSFCDGKDPDYAEIAGLKDLANEDIEMKTFCTKKMDRHTEYTRCT